MKKIITVLFGGILISASASERPFTEAFEAADGINLGSIDGQRGWIVQEGSATVQTGVVQAGSQALEIQQTRLSHDLSSEGSSLWIRFQLRCEGVPENNLSGVDDDTSLAFFVNTNLNLVVYSNNVPVELGVQIQTNEWIRFDIYCDYVGQYWNLSMNEVTVAAGLPLYSTHDQVGSLLVRNNGGAPAYLDQIEIMDTELTTGGLPDSDNDGIPDWWEQKYFGGITSVVADNPSGNTGLTYLEAYIAGVSPTTFDPFVVSPLPGGKGLSWNPVQSRLYSVYWTPDLMQDFTLLQGNIEYPQASFVDGVNSAEPAGFYRLKVEVQL